MLIRLIRPFYHINIIGLFSERIGDFVVDSMHQYIKNKEPIRKQKNIFYISRKNCNSQWTKMVKRNLLCWDCFEHLGYWNKKIPVGEKHSQSSNVFFGSRDIKGQFEKNHSQFKFTGSEIKKAQEWLKSFGWEKGDPFICLIVRDNSYLDEAPDFINRGFDWSYHDYRNSDISEYESSINWLLEQGIWVIRMGKRAKKRADIRHKKFIDYPFLDTKQDLLDIWLFANCELCISTLCGADEISDVYRRPLLLINFLPLAAAKSWSNAMYVPKKLTWTKTGEELTLKENLEHSLYYSKEYTEEGIGIEDLSSEEILLSVKECWNFIRSDMKEVEGSKELQERFWKIMTSSHTSKYYYGEIDTKRYHDWIHPQARAGVNWLRSKGKHFFQ